MAIRKEELHRIGGGRAEVYRFPTTAVRRRAKAQRRRQALVRTVMTVALLVASGALVAHVAAGPVVSSRPGAPATITVRPGQTLWGIARRYEVPGSDPRAYVDAVEELNAVGAGLQAGQSLHLPG